MEDQKESVYAQESGGMEKAAFSQTEDDAASIEASRRATVTGASSEQPVDNGGGTSVQEPLQSAVSGQSEQVAMQEPPQPQQQTMQQLPPGYAVDPQTGQVVYVGQVFQQPQYVQPNVVYVQQQPTPEQLAAQQAEAQQRYGLIVNSVEQFLEGEATVSDVVKTLYTTTSQDDQLWKGVAVGAAAAVLLTSGPVREAMGKTLGGLFPGLKDSGKTEKD